MLKKLGDINVCEFLMSVGFIQGGKGRHSEIAGCWGMMVLEKKLFAMYLDQEF